MTQTPLTLSYLTQLPSCLLFKPGITKLVDVPLEHFAIVYDKLVSVREVFSRYKTGVSGSGRFGMMNQCEGVSTAAAGLKHSLVRVPTRRLIWDPGTQIPGPGLDSPVLLLVGEGGMVWTPGSPGTVFAWWGGGWDGVDTQQPWDSPCLVGVGWCEHPEALRQSLPGADSGWGSVNTQKPRRVLAWSGRGDGVNTRQPGTALDLQARVCRFSMALPTANCRALRECLDLCECGFLHSES